MITINLLPHREAARKKRREQFFVHLGLAAVAGLAVAAAIYAFYEARIAEQQRRNEFLQTEIRKLDVQIKEIATLQQELNSLKARQAAVESLQADRNLPVHLLNEMVTQLPEGVYLRTLRQEGMTISLTGLAQSQERVSELLRNLGGHSDWLTQPQLIEITATTATLGARGQRRVYNFSMRVTLTKGPAPAEPTPAAAKPAAGKA
ncbi:PilN domain-containing protein [Macromonas nakdongensis]|uniref:PilN domain-containing protein n=1 Tax=Macromonas nakdongensis TaxID=1843082 RepID=UPI000C3480E3|nr:PilN domain-containing protein [Macromonas nakdongensis]